MHSPEMRIAVLERIAQGQSVREICRQPDMPGMATVFRWLQEDEAFREQYVRAKESSAEVMADEILDIADDGTNDWMKRNAAENEGWVYNGEAARRSQIRIDARKWLLAKTMPRKYGDKLELAGDPDRPLVTKIAREVVDPK